jgi:glycosyltransferase involved in cell wall biosynthesis
MHRRDLETLRRVIELVWVQDRYVRFVLVTSESNLGFFTGLENVDLRCGLPEPELIKLYQSADLLLQPLQDSTANNSILEGLACGLPVVATDIGGVPDYVDETCGVLVPPKDAEAMADAVLSLLSDESMRRRMATCARTHALQFDWSVVTKQMHQVYAQVLA